MSNPDITLHVKWDQLQKKGYRFQSANCYEALKKKCQDYLKSKNKSQTFELRLEASEQIMDSAQALQQAINIHIANSPPDTPLVLCGTILNQPFKVKKEKQPIYEAASKDQSEVLKDPKHISNFSLDISQGARDYQGPSFGSQISEINKRQNEVEVDNSRSGIEGFIPYLDARNKQEESGSIQSTQQERQLQNIRIAKNIRCQQCGRGDFRGPVYECEICRLYYCAACRLKHCKMKGKAHHYLCEYVNSYQLQNRKSVRGEHPPELPAYDQKFDKLGPQRTKDREQALSIRSGSQMQSNPAMSSQGGEDLSSLEKKKYKKLKNDFQWTDKQIEPYTKGQYRLMSYEQLKKTIQNEHQ